MTPKFDPVETRQGILDDLAIFFDSLDHETRLTAISLVLASWAWQDDQFPDAVCLFRQDVIIRLASPHTFVAEGGGGR